MSFNLKIVAKPFVVIGQGIFKAFEWVPRIVDAIKDGSESVKVIEPKLIDTFNIVESIAQFAIADGKVLLPALKILLEDVKDLGGSGAVNPAKYLQLVNAVNNFIQQVHGLDYTKIVHLVDSLVAEYEDLGVEVKDALQKLGHDLSDEEKQS